MPPIPRVTGPAASYDNPPGTVSLSAATSTVGPNPVYEWALVAYPPSLSPAPILTGANTLTPTLSGATERGTYLIFLKITDDTGSSHAAPYPTQAVAEPFNFTSPLSTAFGVVRVKEVSGLVKPAHGQYGWIEDLWALVDRAGNLFPYYNEATKELQANSVVPATGSTVTVEGGVVALNGETAIQLTTDLGGEISIAPDGNLELSAGGDFTLSNPAILGSLYTDSIESNTAVPLVINGDSVEVNGVDSLRLKTSTGGYAYFEADVDGSISAGNDLSVYAGNDLSLSADNEIKLLALPSGSSLTVASNTIILTNTGNSSLKVDDTNSYLQANAGSARLLGLTAHVEADSDINITAVDDLTLTAGAISLVPTTDTTTLKPIRAPGIPAIQAYFTKSDSPITGDLLDSPPVFTRHQEGSELCADLTLACLLPAGAGAITWELNRVVDGVTSTLLSNVFPVIGPGANWRVLTFRVETKLTNTYTITEIERRQTGTSAPNGVPITATPASTCTFTEEDLVGKDVSFQVKVLSSIDQFYAQGTFCLYNPHEQDVL